MTSRGSDRPDEVEVLTGIGENAGDGDVTAAAAEAASTKKVIPNIRML